MQQVGENGWRTCRRVDAQFGTFREVRHVARVSSQHFRYKAVVREYFDYLPYHG